MRWEGLGSGAGLGGTESRGGSMQMAGGSLSSSLADENCTRAVEFHWRWGQGSVLLLVLRWGGGHQLSPLLRVLFSGFMSGLCPLGRVACGREAVTEALYFSHFQLWAGSHQYYCKRSSLVLYSQREQGPWTSKENKQTETKLHLFWGKICMHKIVQFHSFQEMC